MTKRSSLGRRDLLTFAIGGLSVAGIAGFFPAPAIAARPKPTFRTLSLVNVNTQEKARITYWADGKYDPAAQREISRLLRDSRSGETHHISNNLLDLMNQLQRSLNTSEPLHVICGYRSHETNEVLAATQRGVAKKSFHMEGMAVDLRVPGRGLRQVREAAVRLKGGGVGYYPRSNFVHIDVGPVRKW